MKILITGGAGYIGCLLVPQLLALGHDVTVVDTRMYGGQGLLGSISGRLKYIDMDARMVPRDQDLMNGHDCFIPLAAYVGQPLCDHVGYKETQSVNRNAVGHLARKLTSKQQFIVYTNTTSGYGFKEGGQMLCNEESMMEPTSLYGASKIEAETTLLNKGGVEKPDSFGRIVYRQYPEGNLKSQAVSLRLATVFGPSPRMRMDLLVNTFAHDAYYNGVINVYESDFMRNYVYIGDVVDGIVFSIRHHEEMLGQAYNLGLREHHDKKELASIVAQEVSAHVDKEVTVMQMPSNIVFDPDKRNCVIDVEKLAEVGFVATTPIEYGVARLVTAFQLMDRPWRNGR